MIKKTKEFFYKRKVKKMQRNELLIEVLETLASICLYLDYDGHYSHNRHSEHMRLHFETLKCHSHNLRNGW